jgi:hypothetical protein
MGDAPFTRDELVQCAAAVWAVRAGKLDRILLPEAPLDILAQQIVATAASAETSEAELWALVKGAYPFRNLSRDDFESVLEMLAEGVSTRRGRSTAFLHWDRVHGRIHGRTDYRDPSCYHDDLEFETHQLGRKLRPPIAFPLRISVLEGDVLSFYVAKLAQSLPNGLRTTGLTSYVAGR